jgi:hypothetical protein
MAQREEDMVQFMAAEREAQAAMLSMHANTAREEACMVAEEEAA